ncbi:MAG: glutamate 5-kinase [Coriobacteriia bacterium]|nr:glutamate 5-kinase [Coriobacteriia bacterium]
MAANRRIVIKVGTSTLACAEGGLDLDVASDITRQIHALKSDGWQPILVSSGAIAAGIRALGMAAKPTDMPSLQASASVGQVRILGMYAELFGEFGMVVGQVLLTRNDTKDRQAYLHARDTFDRLLSLGCVPIVNENDTIAVDEIRFGDNDTLAALVAVMVGADLVVLLSDIEGLYSADPRLDAEAELLEHVSELTEQMLSAAGGAGSAMGSGGMLTKVEAAKVLMRAGIPMVVCDGRRVDVITDAALGKPVGTYFAGANQAIGARKLWIAVGHKPTGHIVIDDGAREALTLRGKSLLPAGVVGVFGTFMPGDAIELRDGQGGVVARGLTAVSSADLDRVKGMKSAQIAKDAQHVVGVEVVHRDHLVIL